MIFDGPSDFPESCVHFTRFSVYELREMFAYLREWEQILQAEIVGLGDEKKLRDVRDFAANLTDRPELRLMVRFIELQCAQKMLCWMAHNVTGSKEERALRRRGFGADDAIIEQEKRQQSLWDDRRFTEVLSKFKEEPVSA